MRIAVDVSPLSRPRTGIGNYLRGMLAGLAAVAGDRHEVVAFAPASRHGARHIDEALAGLAVERRVWTLPAARAWRSAWSRGGHPPVERVLGPVDVLHFSDWMYPRQRGGLRATTVHDLVPLRFPALVTRRTRRMHVAKLQHAARTCDMLLCVSRHTAADVTDLLGVSADRVAVAHPGVDPRFHPDGPGPGVEGPYVLAVSTAEPRKNLAALVDAYRALRRRRVDLELRVAGAHGLGERLPRDVEGLRILGYVDDEKLARLYRGAAAMCYPSLFEGFGLPIVEAMTSGVPVVSSDHPSLDDASGEAAVRVDATSPEAIADGIERAIGLRDELVPRGLAHAAAFTWEACGRAVLAGYAGARRA